MSDKHTVLDVVVERLPGWLDWRPANARTYGRAVLATLGIDPTMPYDQFRRWLEWGQRVETAFLFDIDHVDVRYEDGWDACLEHIKGGDDE